MYGSERRKPLKGKEDRLYQRLAGKLVPKRGLRRALWQGEGRKLSIKAELDVSSGTVAKDLQKFSGDAASSIEHMSTAWTGFSNALDQLSAAPAIEILTELTHAMIARDGCLRWQATTGYGKRSLV